MPIKNYYGGASQTRRCIISKVENHDRKVVDECFLLAEGETNSETSFACEAGLEDTTGVSPWSFIFGGEYRKTAFTF